MGYLKFIMVVIWVIVIVVSGTIFVKSLFVGNVFGIRISFAVMILAIPTLISIVKEVK